jgi:hypothetical protein
MATILPKCLNTCKYLPAVFKTTVKFKGTSKGIYLDNYNY